jgi:hypothetical protein
MIEETRSRCSPTWGTSPLSTHYILYRKLIFSVFYCLDSNHAEFLDHKEYQVDYTF